jgi:hypothetical protein
VVGGGDAARPDINRSLWQCVELKKDESSNSVIALQKNPSKYPRHGHSIAGVMDTFFIVTGSLVVGYETAVETYNMRTNTWSDKHPLNEGRYYHSSCCFKEKWIYVFCGITKKFNNVGWTTSIERLNVFTALGEYPFWE